MNDAKKFLSTALVLSVLSIWVIAQTNQTVAQKAETEIAVTQVKSVQGLTNSQLLSSAGTIIATNNGVTITQGPGATAAPEGPEPQGGWFTPLYTAEGVIKRVSQKDKKILYSSEEPFSISVGSDGKYQLLWQEYKKNKSAPAMDSNQLSFDGRSLFLKKDTISYSANAKEGAPSETNTAMSVYRGPVPVGFSGSPVGLLWVAFLGGDYLSSKEKDRLPNLFFAGDRISRANWCVDFKYKLLDDAPIISFGEFIFNTHYVLEDLVHYQNILEPTNEGDLITLSNEVNKLLNIPSDQTQRALYSLEKSELVENQRIPTQFYSLARFDIGSPLATALPGYKMEAHVTNIVVSPSTVPLLPKVVGEFIVQDERFWARTSNTFRGTLFYRSTNGWDAALESSKLTNMGNRAWEPRGFSHKHIHPERNTLYYSTLILILILVAVPFVFHKKIK